MAYIKIFPIKSTMKRVMAYITNPDKTDDQMLISSFQCVPETADIEFFITTKQGKENLRHAGSNLGWHLIQSFKPGEITDPQKAHELGKQFADQVLKGQYQYIITTHIDKGHCHNHIVFCATSFKDYHMYQSPKHNIYKLCRISNRICRENGLEESIPTGKKSRSYKENMEYKRGNSWKYKLKQQVDRAVWSSVNFEEFLFKMEQAEYEIRKGKYLAFRAPGQVNFTNVKTLGAFYTEDSIRSRLEKNRHKTIVPTSITTEVQLFIEIGNYVAEDDREGFREWAELHNLQEAARTFNYLSNHNLLNYEEFQNHISDMNDSIAAVENDMAKIDAEIMKQVSIKKSCDAYRHCRDIVNGEKNVGNKKAYRQKHAREYELHNQIMLELQDLGISRIPSSEKIQKQIENLEEKKVLITKDLQQKKIQQKNLQIVQTNMKQLFQNVAVHLFEEQSKRDIPELS